MNKNKIIFSIFAAIFFANFSFGMDGLANEFNGMALNEYELDEITAAYQAELRDAYDGVSTPLPEMNEEQTVRYNGNQGARRRLNFNL